jgi:hypothetical protein
MSVEDDVHAVQKHFPNAYCTSYKNKFCIAWDFELEPIIAVGAKPKRAWANAAKLLKGKNKKAIDKLKKKLMEEEVDNTRL